MNVDSRDARHARTLAARATHARNVRAKATLESALKGGQYRAASYAANRPVNARRVTCSPEVWDAIENTEANRACIAEALKDAESFLRISPHATREGWQTLWQRGLVARNPVASSLTREQLLALLAAST